MPDNVDRIAGISSSKAIKVPCLAATTAAITLSGEQTVDGVSLVDGNRCLVKDQASTATNGIYTVSTGAWTRALDFDGTTDWVRGTIVPIAGGTTNGGKIYRVTTSDPVDIDTDAISFTSISFLDSHANGSVAASATIDLTAIDADAVDVTGSGATITAVTLTAGYTRIIRFTGVNTITHSATLVLPGALNIATAAGDIMIVRGYAVSTVRVVGYMRGNSQPLITGEASIASAATTDLGSVREQSITITGTTGITSFGTSAPTGTVKFIRLSGAILLTNGASLICPGGGSIQGASGDTFIARAEAAGVWRILNYVRAAPRVYTDTTQNTNATTAESDLTSYTLPAGQLASSGAAIRIRAWGIGTTVSTAVTRRLRLYFGNSVIADSGAINVPTFWRLEATVIRSSAAGAQDAFGETLASTGGGGSVSYFRSGMAESLSSAITIKLTGLCTASSAVLTQTGLVVEPLYV